MLTDLVPVWARLRWTLLCRAILTPAVAAVALLSGQPGTAFPLGVLCLFWSVSTALMLPAARRNRRTASTVINISLLGDGVTLAVVWFMLGGLQGEGGFLVLLHIIGVTLLASFRTGAKITVWHGLLAIFVVQAQAVGLLEPLRPVPGLPLALYLAQLAGTALVTASFAAVNERELRRRRYDDEMLRDAAAAFMSDTDPVSIARRLAYLVNTELLARRTLVLVEIESEDVGAGDTWAVVVAREASQHLRGPADPPESADLPEPINLPGAIGRNRLVARSLVEGTVLVRSVHPATDPDLTRLLPDGHDLACVPFIAQQVHGVMVFEHARTRIPWSAGRIHRRVLATAQHATSLAAMALTRAAVLHRLRAIAHTDPLTGVANRRTFDTKLQQLLQEARDHRAATAILLVDLDHFKLVNDQHGHQAGDDVLRRTGAALLQAVRPGDVVARYGGEEFSVIMPHASTQAAVELAEHIRATLQNMPGAFPVTASIGVASTDTVADIADALVAEADIALYAAKSAGRNRVVSCTGPSRRARTDDDHDAAHRALAQQQMRIPASGVPPDGPFDA
jgi:diguanylate cyclase (GGDEF)-like protein